MPFFPKSTSVPVIRGKNPRGAAWAVSFLLPKYIPILAFLANMASILYSQRDHSLHEAACPPSVLPAAWWWEERTGTRSLLEASRTRKLPVLDHMPEAVSFLFPRYAGQVPRGPLRRPAASCGRPPVPVAFRIWGAYHRIQISCFFEESLLR